jgi:hypothetical protein
MGIIAVCDGWKRLVLDDPRINGSDSSPSSNNRNILCPDKR